MADQDPSRSDKPYSSDEDRHLLRVIGSTIRRIINGDPIERVVTERRDELGVLVNMVNRVGKELAQSRKRDAMNLSQLEQRVAELQAARETQEKLRYTIAEISTPVLNIFESVSLVPLIGHIDGERAQQVISTLLNHVASNRSKVVILDVTAVAVLDTQVAHVLVQAAQSCRLLGAHVILCGMTPDVAQVVVSLGINMSIFTTRNDLQEALNTALRMLRYRIVGL